MARNMNFKPVKGRAPMPRKKANKGTLKRLLSMLFTGNKKLLSVVLVCILISATTGVASSIFLDALVRQIDLGLTN